MRVCGSSCGTDGPFLLQEKLPAAKRALVRDNFRNCVTRSAYKLANPSLVSRYEESLGAILERATGPFLATCCAWGKAQSCLRTPKVMPDLGFHCSEDNETHSCSSTQAIIEDYKI
jgi:hypothetical protein